MTMPDPVVPDFHDAPEYKFFGGRMLAAEIDALTEWARFHGRTLDAELKLIIRRALREHALEALRCDPEGIEARGHDVDEDRDRIQDDLDRLTHEMFDRPTQELVL
jgi:hypothetical protein